MSQARARKVMTAVPDSDKASKKRTSVAPPADEPRTRAVQSNHNNQRSRSKNKIPKSVRYDLETALVGLCDVWFGEIKPHLVRNNIKLHVHGDVAVPGRASGDYEHLSPHTAANCSHIDPGAALDHRRRTRVSCVGSYSTQPIASKAPCPKPQASCPQRQPSRLSPVSQQECVQYQRRNCEKTQVPRPNTGATHLHKKKRTSKTQSHQSWQVPRLCRTSTFMIPSMGAHTRSAPHFDETYIRELFKSVFNKVPFDHRHHRRKVTLKTRSTQTDLTALPIWTASVGATSVGYPPPSVLVGSRSFSRRKGTTSLLPTRFNTCSDMYPNTTSHKKQTLFENDLIDIIGDKNDKRLKIIYNNPEQVKYTSVMNLFSPKNKQSKIALKRNPPWR